MLVGPFNQQTRRGSRFYVRRGGGHTSWRGVWGPVGGPGGQAPRSSWELENIGPLL
jgi:hypothetical protein